MKLLQIESINLYWRHSYLAWSLEHQVEPNNNFIESVAPSNVNSTWRGQSYQMCRIFVSLLSTLQSYALSTVRRSIETRKLGIRQGIRRWWKKQIHRHKHQLSYETGNKGELSHSCTLIISLLCAYKMAAPITRSRLYAVHYLRMGQQGKHLGHHCKFTCKLCCSYKESGGAQGYKCWGMGV